MKLTKQYETELYVGYNATFVEAGYSSDDEEIIERGDYLKTDPSIIVIIENENNEIAFYKQFSISTGTYYASLLTTPTFREGFDPIQMAIELAYDGFGITLEEPSLLTVAPLNFSEHSDESFYIVYGRCSGYKEEEADEIFWIHKPNAFIRLKHQLTKGTPFALEHEGVPLNGISIASLMLMLHNS